MFVSETALSDKADVLRQTTALGDYFGLLSVLLEYKLLKDSAVALLEGRLQSDIRSIAEELGIQDGRVVDTLRLLDKARGELCGTGDAGEDAAEVLEVSYRSLRREYTRLFNHPESPAVAFYEGMFVNRRYLEAGRSAPDHELLFINQAACDAERQYKRAGVKRSAEENIPGDCMATEMAFMNHLLQSETEALVAEDSVRYARLFAWRQEFAYLHLRVWMDEFYQQVEALGQQPYFCAVGLLGQTLAAYYSHCYPYEQGTYKGGSS